MKPENCKLCGSKAIIEHWENCEFQPRVRVKCSNTVKGCKNYGEEYHEEDEDLAIKHWNNKNKKE